MIVKHYDSISEATAREAKQAYSFFDYAEGSATDSYQKAVDECYTVACWAAERRPREEERIQRLLDWYIKCLANNINARNRNTASCPSVLIAGASNFPVRKKEKQNQRDDKLMAEYNHIMQIPDKIRSIGLNTTIYSDEEDAIEQLEAKVEKCRKTLESMKAQNAYYRKHGTMKGFGDFTDEYTDRFDREIESRYSYERKPFRDWELTSVREKMKAAEKRVEKLKSIKKSAENQDANEYTAINGIKVVENAEIMRLQLFFDEKPNEDTRSLLKRNGFRFSPSNGNAWQRNLNDNSKAVLNGIMEELKSKFSN